MKRNLLIILILISSVALGRYPDCGASSQDSIFKIKTICNGVGEVIQVVKYLKSKNTLSNITFYEEGEVIAYKSWSSDGKNVLHDLYSHPGDGTTIKTILKPGTEIVTGKYQFIAEENNPMKAELDVKEWKYDSRDDYKTKQVSEFIYINNQKLISYREIYRKGELYRSYKFKYDPISPERKHPLSYEEYGPHGEFITFYEPGSFSLEDYLDEYGDIPNRKYKVAVIDSEFDVSHPMLAGYLYINPNEKLDGINQDGNKWVDDIMGWNHETNSPTLLSPILLEMDGGPASHGTHVASLAMMGHENFSLVGYAGDMTSVDHMKNITTDLQIKNIPFTNMSFGLGNPHGTFSAGPEAIRAVGELIQHTPNTLHVIAAGNDGHEIDSYKLHNYPASFNLDNILVVAALNTDKLELNLMDTYELTDFTNFGVINTDIAAPGTMLEGAAPGGGIIRYSGTSMASPFTLNHGVMRAYEINPNLSIYQIKNLVMKCAYIKDLDNPMPVRSGGILYPERIAEAAKLLKTKPELTVQEAVLEIRKKGTDLLPGESNDEEYLRKLVQFWNDQSHLTNKSAKPILD